MEEKLREEVHPKNILMMGPTGVGKTEIARRIANLCNAPFIKVEATKYTEVGFHGSDVDTIIKDLLNVGIAQKKKELRAQCLEEIKTQVEDRLLALLVKELPDRWKSKFRAMLREGVLDDLEIKFPSFESEEQEAPAPTDGQAFQTLRFVIDGALPKSEIKWVIIFCDKKRKM